MNADRFSFSTGALFPLNSEDALQLVRGAGFPNAELMPQALSDASEKSTLLFEKTGVRISSIHYPLVMFGALYTAHKAMRDDGRRFSRALLKMGRRMGTRVLVVHPHEPPSAGHPDLLERPVVDNLLWLADLCGEQGVTMAMENSPKTCATAEQLLDYVKALNHPAIRPMADTTEVCEAGGDPAAFLQACPPCHVHMSDFAGAKKHLPAGEGSIDWRGVRRALDSHGYGGFYTLEPSYRYYLDDIGEKLAAARRFLEETFGD